MRERNGGGPEEEGGEWANGLGSAVRSAARLLDSLGHDVTEDCPEVDPGSYDILMRLWVTAFTKYIVSRGIKNQQTVNVILDECAAVMAGHGDALEEMLTVGRGFKLIGGPKSPRDAVGATVYLTADGVRQRGDVLSGGGYLSSNDKRVHFGLGASRRVKLLELSWPSGKVQRLENVAADRIMTVREP